MTNPVAAALRSSGDLFGFCVDVLRAVPRRPFQVREFVQQAWFIASVTIVPFVDSVDPPGGYGQSRNLQNAKRLKLPTEG